MYFMIQGGGAYLYYLLEFIYFSCLLKQSSPKLYLPSRDLPYPPIPSRDFPCPSVLARPLPSFFYFCNFPFNPLLLLLFFFFHFFIEFHLLVFFDHLRKICSQNVSINVLLRFQPYHVPPLPCAPPWFFLLHSSVKLTLELFN